MPCRMVPSEGLVPPEAAGTGLRGGGSAPRRQRRAGERVCGAAGMRPVTKAGVRSGVISRPPERLLCCCAVRRRGMAPEQILDAVPLPGPSARSLTSGVETPEAARSGGDDAVADGVAHQVGDVARADLPHDGRAVRLHRFHRHFEPPRDLLVAVPLGEQLQHLALARGEAGIPGGRVLGRALAQERAEYGRGNLRAEEGLVLRECLDGRDDVARRVRLDEVAARSRREDLAA